MGSIISHTPNFVLDQERTNQCVIDASPELSSVWHKTVLVLDALRFMSQKTNIVRDTMLPAFREKSLAALQDSYNDMSQLMSDSLGALTEFIGCVLAGNLDSDDEKYTQAMKALKELRDCSRAPAKLSPTPDSTKASPSDAMPACTGGTTVTEIIEDSRSHLPPRLISWQYYLDAYKTTTSYALLKAHMNLMVDILATVQATATRPPVIYSKPSMLLYNIMKSNGLINSNSRYTRKRVIAPDTAAGRDMGNINPAFYQSSLQGTFQQRGDDTVTTVFPQSVNMALLKSGTMTTFLEVNPKYHYSDMYMGIWYLVAWHLLKGGSYGINDIMSLTFFNVCNNFLVPALDDYLETYLRLKGDIGYKPVFDSAKTLESLRPIGNDDIEEGGPMHLPTSTSWEERWKLYQTYEPSFTGTDFTPYITWPRNNYGTKSSALTHSMVNKSNMAKELFQKVFFHSMSSTSRPNTGSTMEHIARINGDSTKFKDSVGVFRVLASYEGMRRVAVLGINVLLFVYCLLKSRANQFQEYVISYLTKKLTKPKYTPTAAAFPGAWLMLLMYDRECTTGSSCEASFMRTRVDVHEMSSVHFDSSPSAIRRLVKLINLSQKDEDESVEHKHVLLRNIIMQESEKSLNAIYDSILDGETVSQRIKTYTYFSDIYMSDIMDLPGESTLLAQYINQGFNFSHSFDILN